MIGLGQSLLFNDQHHHALFMGKKLTLVVSHHGNIPPKLFSVLIASNVLRDGRMECRRIAGLRLHIADHPTSLDGG